jgi:hypothetical protein
LSVRINNKESEKPGKRIRQDLQDEQVREKAFSLLYLPCLLNLDNPA